MRASCAGCFAAEPIEACVTDNELEARVPQDKKPMVGYARSGDPKEAAAAEARMVAAVPMGRLCRPHEAVLWLASDNVSYVTGVALPVDGGFTAR